MSRTGRRGERFDLRLMATSDIAAAQDEQYGSCFPSTRSQRPPQRSQYFNSNCRTSISSGSMISSTAKLVSHGPIAISRYPQKEKALRRCIRLRARFSYDDLF